MRKSARKMSGRRIAVVIAFVGALTTVIGSLLLRPAAAQTAQDLSPKVGDTAPDFTLETLTGGTLKLGNVAKQGPLVLVLLRGYPGYQCPICTMQVGDLTTRTADFARAKARVVLVYPGPAAQLKARAAEFAPAKNLPSNFTLVLDPDYKLTNRYHLRWDAPGETSYPSTFVLDAKRHVLWMKTSHSHGGRATAAEILTALGEKEDTGTKGK